MVFAALLAALFANYCGGMIKGKLSAQGEEAQLAQLQPAMK